MSKTNNQAKRQMRAIGHKLKPVVTVAGKGLSDTVIGEIDRALSDHELIKIKLAVGGKEERTQVSEELCKRTKAEIVHSIGNISYLRPCRQWIGQHRFQHMRGHDHSGS